ncbi:tetratricopeptide repeat protein [Thermodesulfobacteriota bacterium]
MFNKSKDLNNIQKLIQRGQIDKAIKKLEAIIDVDPNDASLYIKSGDLYLRKNRKPEAKESYFKAANIYLRDGYNTRAIATYKMVSRIAPEDLDVCMSLAELFEKQGLIGDALQQYKHSATIYEQNKNYDEMSKSLKKILEIDPDNIPAKIKTAEVFFINDNKDEAYALLAETSKDLKSKKQYADCIKAFQMLLKVSPNDKFLLKEIASAHILAGNSEEGLKVIQAAQKLDPKDTGSLLLLAETYLLLDKLNDSESIYCDLIRNDEKNHHARLGLSKIFLKKDNLEEALKGIEPYYSAFEENGELNELTDFYDNALQKDPSNIAVLEKLGEIYRYNNNSKKLCLVYDKLAEVYIASDQADKATFLYQKIIQINPNHEKAKLHINKIAGGAAPAAGVAASADMDEETVSEHITEANVYLKYGLYDQAQEHIDPVLSAQPNNVEAHIAMKDIFVAQNNKNEAIDKLLFLVELKPDSSEDFLNEILKIDPENSAAQEMLKGGAPAATAKAPEKERKVETFDGIDLIIEEPTELKETKAKKKDAKKPAKSLQAEQEEADFYFAEGLYDDAKAIYNRILLDDPYNTTALERLEQIEKQTANGAPAGAAEETAGAGDEDQLFDFAKELEDALPDDLLNPPDAPQAASDAGFEDSQSTDDIFSKFKKGLEEHIDSKDFDSHYNLGIAYKEMGLLSDSVEEFEKALSADSSKVFECCAMLGMVCLELHKYKEAIVYFEKIFSDVDVPQEQVTDLRYELAIAYKENEQYDKALRNFNIIQEIDPAFRDVEENIRIVMDYKESGKQGKQPEKKRNISYV